MQQCEHEATVTVLNVICVLLYDAELPTAMSKTACYVLQMIQLVHNQNLLQISDCSAVSMRSQLLV